MGLIQRDSIELFRNLLKTSRQHSTFCITLADAGWLAGTGIKRGSDPRTMAQSDLIVMWGGNPVYTQVNVMHHVARARRERNARLVVIDPYRTATAKKANQHLMLKPGTDGALVRGSESVSAGSDASGPDLMLIASLQPDAVSSHRRWI